MRERSTEGFADYQPNRLLKGIYKQADDLDGDALRILCPSYTELASVKYGPERYSQKALVGKGALKKVYRCFDERTRRFIAWACPREELDADCFDDFVHEAWLVSSLSHPNIIKVHDAGVDAQQRPFFTMDLKGNTTLADMVKQGAARRSLLEVFLKICDAVAYAHAQGVIHRDLKPSNIQCEHYGEVLVCDWGLGKYTDSLEREEEAGADELMDSRQATMHGDIKGSPGYMAPEQIEAGREVDERCDIFALGCLLHFILTGSAPFQGSRDEILNDTLESERISAGRAYPQCDIPKSLDAVMLQAIALDPQARYQSVALLQADIYNYLNGHGTWAERPSLLRRTILFVQRNKIPVSITLAALAVLLISGFIFTKHLERKERERAEAQGHSLQLSAEIDELNAEYDVLMEQFQQPKKELARRLTAAATEKKNDAVFKQPVLPFREANMLIAKALELDPDLAAARFQYFSNHCIMLNFKEAMQYPVDPKHPMAGYRQYVEAFPDFAYTETTRPSLAELTDFIQEARKIDTRFVHLITAILAYDFEARSDTKHYGQVVGAALEYMNPGTNGVTAEYSEALHQLRLSSGQSMRVTFKDRRPQNMVMRFLELDTLILDVDGRFNLSSLAESSIKRLDLSLVQEFQTSGKPIRIKGLEEVIIRQNQPKATMLQSQIKSDSGAKLRFTLIELGDS